MSRGDARVKSADEFLCAVMTSMDSYIFILGFFIIGVLQQRPDVNSYTFYYIECGGEVKKLVLMEFRLLNFFLSLHAVIIYCPLHRRYIDSIKEIKRLICAEKKFMRCHKERGRE